MRCVRLVCYLQKGALMDNFKSPRAVEAEITQYKYDTFDRYIDAARRGEIEIKLAIQAFKDETDGNPSLTTMEETNNDL